MSNHVKREKPLPLSIKLVSVTIPLRSLALGKITVVLLLAEDYKDL